MACRDLLKWQRAPALGAAAESNLAFRTIVAEQRIAIATLSTEKPVPLSTIASRRSASVGANGLRSRRATSASARRTTSRKRAEVVGRLLNLDEIALRHVIDRRWAHRPWPAAVHGADERALRRDARAQLQAAQRVLDAGPQIVDSATGRSFRINHRVPAYHGGGARALSSMSPSPVRILHGRALLAALLVLTLAACAVHAGSAQAAPAAPAASRASIVIPPPKLSPAFVRAVQRVKPRAQPLIVRYARRELSRQARQAILNTICGQLRDAYGGWDSWGAAASRSISAYVSYQICARYSSA